MTSHRTSSKYNVAYLFAILLLTAGAALMPGSSCAKAQARTEAVGQASFVRLPLPWFLVRRGRERDYFTATCVEIRSEPRLLGQVLLVAGLTYYGETSKQDESLYSSNRYAISTTGNPRVRRASPSEWSRAERVSRSARAKAAARGSNTFETASWRAP
jgi:hypothetical protein